MNITTTILQNKIKALVIAFAVVLLGFLIGFLTTNTSAIPYVGEDTLPTPTPAFNVYTGVPDEGDESDFFKGKVAGSSSASVNNVVSTCESGAQFQLRAYVHNGASDLENGDGDGPSVAKDTKIRVALPTNEASEFVPSATISSSNAASVSDTMTITCSDGRVVTVSYVAGTAKQFTTFSGTQPISDSIVTTGAPIGTMSPNGDVWGCWDQRVWVTLIVEVTEVPEELHPAVCEAILTTLLSSNQIRVDGVEYDLRDATLNDIEISYGDNTTVNVQPSDFALDPHTYANPGTYTIRATLNTTFEGNPDPVTSPACATEITVEEEEKETPVYACTDPDFVLEGRKATFSFIPTAENGATFENANILYFSNGNEVNSDTQDVVNADGRVVSNYTFDDNAVNVSANATLRFNVNDKVEEVECAGEDVLGAVTPPPVTPPTTLPVTGAGSIAGIMAGVAAIGAYAHRALTLKRQ